MERTERKGFVLGVEAKPGNIHNSKMLESLVEDVIGIVGKPKAVAGDAAYKTPTITKYLIENDRIPAPYTRPRTKEGFFRKHEYVYDEHYDCYICPAGEILKYSTMTKLCKTERNN